MTITSNGSISISDLQDEFGGSGSTTWRMSDYYKGGSYVSSSVIEGSGRTIPTGGRIDLSDFYGAQNYVPPSTYTYTLTSNTQGPWDMRAAAIADGWDGILQLFVVINPNVYVWSDSTSSAAMFISGNFPNGVTITNNGFIMGKGGNGGSIGATAGPTDGGPAILCSSTCSINNVGYIGGGGGGGAPANYNVSNNASSSGGGGGAGGGHGGSASFYNAGANLAIIALGGDGGSIGQSGSNADNFRTFYGSGNSQSDILTPGAGGGAGGGGGNGTTSNSTGSGGGGGGRIFPGTGGATSGGQAGGSSNNAGSNATSVDGAGGGGWGAAGGDGNVYDGGAGGAAISGSGHTIIGGSTRIYGSY